MSKFVPGLRWRDIDIDDTRYQVFRRPGSDQTLFRFEVSKKVDGQWNGWWNYGVCQRADFNNDGVDDYHWYGGDDTGEEDWLVLSSPSGYRKIEVRKTIEREWSRRFKTKPPDLGYEGLSLLVMRVLEEEGKLSLLVHIQLEKRDVPLKMRIGAEYFLEAP